MILPPLVFPGMAIITTAGCVVEPSTHHPKFKGSNPTIGTWREKIDRKQTYA
jgi:hypothetical protein